MARIIAKIIHVSSLFSPPVLLDNAEGFIEDLCNTGLLPNNKGQLVPDALPHEGQYGHSNVSIEAFTQVVLILLLVSIVWVAKTLIPGGRTPVL